MLFRSQSPREAEATKWYQRLLYKAFELCQNWKRHRRRIRAGEKKEGPGISGVEKQNEFA